MKITEQKIRDIIAEYNDLYDNIPPIDYVIIGNCKNVTTAPAMVTNVEDEYGMFINTDDYMFTEETLVPIVLHEMVHYYLLLNGKQSKGDAIHDDTFQQKASEIEEKTDIKGIMYGKNKVHETLRYKNKRQAFVFLKNREKDLLCITKIPEKRIKYWLKYLRSYCKNIGYDEYKVEISNKCLLINNITSFSNGTNLECNAFELSENEHIFCP